MIVNVNTRTIDHDNISDNSKDEESKSQTQQVSIISKQKYQNFRDFRVNVFQNFNFNDQYFN